MGSLPFFAALKSAIVVKLKDCPRVPPAEEDILKAMHGLLPMLAPAFGLGMDEALYSISRQNMLAMIPIQMKTGSVLRRHEIPPPWVEAADIQWKCWEAYIAYLLGKGYPDDVIRVLGEDTQKIMDLMGNPASGDSWDRRGLVLGHVQSGKTSNYSGLLCRAADAGYRLFIVITGIHENLRAQTQQRLDEAFINQSPADMRPISLTTTTDDFSRLKAEQRIPPQAVGTSLVLVVKKNARVLENLLQWLGDNSKPGGDWADMSLLLIDDEADNASVNTSKEEHNPTKINRLIRSLLNSFRKSSYIGYTATPFANIFIDPETEHEMYSHDLFPADFIYCLSAPSNYFGAEKVFFQSEDESYPVLKPIDDAEDLLPASAKAKFVPVQLPESLVAAVRTFFLACCIRILRHQSSSHMSMLINVSPWADVQRHVKLLLDEEVRELRNIISASAFMPNQQKDFWAALEELFLEQYGASGVSWSEIRKIIPEVARSIQTRVINSRSQDALDYQNYTDSGLRVIAVGGYTLSRGLTLEGLMVSYWNRNSKAYDTLLQMGRWFGYRDLYDDLCRVWMPRTAQGWYTHIAEVSQELRDELISMSQRQLTPADFGLKVRNHPETLIVTAMNKRRSAGSRVVRPDLSGRLLETWVVHRNTDKLRSNYAAAEALVSQVIKIRKTENPFAGEADPLVEGDGAGPFLWRDIPANIVEDFFMSFQAHPQFLPHADNGYLFAYLNALKERLEKSGQQLTWDIGLFSSKRQKVEHHVSFAGLDVWKQVRSAGVKIVKSGKVKQTLLLNDPQDPLVDGYRVTSNQRVATRGMEKLPLSDPRQREAEADWQASQDKTEKIADHWYRAKLERPLLMLHLIDLIEPDEGDKVLLSGVAAWGISFPPYTELDITAHEYTVSKNWMRLFETVETEPEDE